MAKERKRKKYEDTGNPEDIETTVDPYTRERKPVAEDAGQFIEVVPEETDDRQGKNYILNEETSMDSYAADSDADAVAEQSAHYTEDEEIEADFTERQQLAVGGRDELLEELDEHNSLSPEISGGDLDASWQTGNVAGEETVGGSAPTPDQDVVDELGAAAGLVYRDDEPLDSDGKILDRDRNRWELNPASADDEEEEKDEEDIDDEDDLDDLEDALDDEEALEEEDDLEIEELDDEEDEDNDLEDEIEDDEDQDL
jgi:Family of unknown function (DUF6335)